MQGTVHDPAGNVIPHASVSITNTDRGVETDVTVDDKGLFVAPPLPIGNYSVKVSSQGFATWEAHLTLRVDQVVDLEPRLKVGSDTQQVTVQGDVSPLVNNENQTVGNTLDYNRILTLPENGRNIGSLITLTTPGITGSAPASGTGTNQFKANGINANGFEFVQDGAALANQDYGGQAQLLPDPDSIGEAKVETSNSSAKFNRPATAVLSTKSGTNALHGSLYETMRNNSFGVAKARQDTFTRAPKLIRNEFGASAGGPIMIPKLYDGRGHSFFFVSFSGLELRQNVTKQFQVPTDAERNGDFSGLTTSNGQLYTIYDPATTTVTGQRTAFPGNVIPAARMAPLAKSVYAIMPHASNQAINPLITYNLNQPTPNNNSARTITARVDHKFSDADTAYIRFTHGSADPYAYGSSNYGPAATNLEANITFQPVKTDTGSLTWNHIFTPHFFVESLLSHAYESDSVYTGPNPNVDYAAQFGLPSIGALGFPNIYGVGFMPYGLGRNDNTRKNSQNTTVLDENFTYVKGNHVLQFGGRYRHERTWIFVDQNPTPSQVNFSSLGTGLLDPTSVAGGGYTAVGNTGYTNASFFLGYAQYYQVSKLQQWYHFRNQEIASYFQDDWKVTPKLTLNLGLRWEIHPALHEADGLFGGYDFANNAIITGPSLQSLYAAGKTSAPIVANYTNLGAKFESAADAGLPPSLVDGNYADFAPRVGFAYQLFSGKEQTVIRGGYGTYIYPPPTRNFYAETRLNPPYQATFQESYTSAAQAPDGLPNYMLRSPQTIYAGENSAGVVSLNTPSSVTAGSFGVSGLDRHYPSTFVHQWNVTVEHAMPFSSAIRATYLGNHGQDLEQYWEYNDAPSSYVWYVNTGKALPTGSLSGVLTRPYSTLPYGYIENQRKTGYSNDNSIQLDYQRLNRNGWGYQVFYVLSNDFRNGGNGWRDSSYEPASYFLNGAAPSDASASNRWQNYVRDLTIPQHQIRWNWLVDLPFGRGKHFFGGANAVTNAIIGGWRISSDGYLFSQRFTPSTSYYEPTTISLYKKRYPVQDCRSGTCLKSYMWFNGYIPANKVNAAGGVTGVPTNYTPFNGPLIRTPANGGSTSDPNYAYYDTNSIVVSLANGSTVRTTYNPDISPTHAMSVQGPFNWTMDASIFKEFQVHDSVKLRLNADFFNVLNMQGLNNPDSGTGLIALTSSYNTPRQLQITARLQF